MALDFDVQTQEVQNSTCKSVLQINCIDNEQNVFLVKVTNFRTYFYVMAPDFKDLKDINKFLLDLT